MRVGRVLGGLLVAAAFASTSLAQSAPGRIVQSSDGTLYVLRDGARFAIVAEPIEDEELGSFADGGTIGAAELLPASVAVAPIVAVAPTAAPQTDNPIGAGPVLQPEPAAGAPPAQPGSPSRAKQPANGPLPPTSATQAALPRFTSVQGNAPGKVATVSVQAAPGVYCSISYLTTARTRGTSAGLDPQTVGPSGVATWSFLIGAATQPGTGSVTVTCGTAAITSPLQIEGLTK